MLVAHYGRRRRARSGSPGIVVGDFDPHARPRRRRTDPPRSPMSIHTASTSHRLRLSCLLALAVCTLLASPVFAEEASKKPAPTPGAFTIETFRLESGVVLPSAVVIYGTYGTLNAAKNNAVLLPSHYMAQSDGYDWLVGEGRALDPRKHFLIMTELFGNGR